MFELEMSVARNGVSIEPATAPRKRAYAARVFTDRVMRALADRYDLIANHSDCPMDALALAQAAKGCDYVFITVTERLDQAAIAALSPDLKVIATLSVGVDHIGSVRIA